MVVWENNGKWMSDLGKKNEMGASSQRWGWSLLF